ncbi:MAG: DUF1353 domain-containing protein [Clostridia bacterium]|nr:DUF1353 domain-containing protein [Clostridia bacterium]
MSKEIIEKIELQPCPKVKIRVICDDEPEEIKKNKKQYPFELFNSVEVKITTNFRVFKFPICKGYVWNGADIPRFCWRLVGSRTDNDFLIASMLHDYMLEMKVFLINEVLKNQITVSEYRRLTSLIFREKIKAQGTNTIKANVMAWCVDVFQMFNKKSWNI